MIIIVNVTIKLRSLINLILINADYMRALLFLVKNMKKEFYLIMYVFVWRY